jgi:hypothetical protein
MINLTLAIIAMLSLILAAIMTVVAWTTVRQERRRSAARVAVLAAAIHDHADLLIQPRSGAGDALPVEPTTRSRRRLAAAGVVALLAVGAVTGLVLLAEGSRGRAGSISAHVAPPAIVPLELIALEQDRDESRLVVRGIVRNPGSAAKLNGLTVVVLVFSGDGGFIGSGRAPVATTSLAAGAEAPFVVTLPDADSVDRYRVSFRTDDRIVPHIDRRGRNPIGRTE